MRTESVRSTVGAVATAVLVLVPPVVHAQEVVGHHVMLSGTAGSVSFELADGASRLITIGGGRILADGEEIGIYQLGSAFERTWFDLLRSNANTTSSRLLEALQDWAVAPDGAGVPERAALAELLEGLEAELLTDVAAPVVASAPASNRLEVVIPEIEAPNVVIPRVEIPRLAAVPSVVQSSPSIVGFVGSGAASLMASLVALSLMGFGFLFFAPRQLRAVGDTVWGSFGRSFLAGLFAQPLLLPVLGALIAGLVLTVVGILLVPIAIPAFAMAVFLAITGGYVAMARSVGEIFVRRRNRGVVPTEPWVEMKFIVFGLVGLLAIWIPAVLLGWIPIVGPVFIVLAGILTWVLATAGFGASIISRGGIRGTVVRRIDRALSDPDYWADTGAFRRSDSMVDL